ncbi:hypothetical protein GX51_07243 [Blastomyces parvus]|uniref:Uncharacterized protein n=1 Tax=Blastomyces parvus TaxID=2060905 RepID=A0A2B7WM68_9EURO|nr:hypothetical protein GX51_07243 [Blastomyces parvus]
MISFEERFGKAETGDVDYDTIPEKKLKMPVSTDSLPIVAEKLRDLVQVVNEGKSIAVATEFEGTRYQERDPVKLASMSFTPQEEEQYSARRAGEVRLPEFDWAANMDDSQMPPSVAENMEQHVNTMNMLWDTNKARTSHVRWLFNNWGYMAPLVTAFARVEKAKKDLVDGSDYATADRIAEIQTIENAILETRQVLGRLKACQCSRVTLRDIAYSRMALANRTLAIKKKIAERIPKGSTPSERDMVLLSLVEQEFEVAVLAAAVSHE